VSKTGSSDQSIQSKPLKPQSITPPKVPKEIEPEKIEDRVTSVEKEKLTITSEASKTPIIKREVKPPIEASSIPKSHKAYVPQKSWIQTFKENNPDLEKFIGENLINKIGILILVLGISFFVKYAIDKEWINEPARVGIGILAGALVMFVAHKLKKNYASFSSVLVAGAISIFYFTIYTAFHSYQLFNQTVAFSIMAVITAFSTLVSISYNKQELAILSLIGGFSAPFLVSTGEGNYIVLFSYIVILNIGILGVSYFKKWRIVTILAFIFTTVLFLGWFAVKEGTSSFSYTGALIFSTIFYFLFSIIIVLNNLRNKGVFSKIEYFILVANTFFFYGIGITILSIRAENFRGLFTLLLAVYNIGYAWILYKKFGLDKNAIYLLIGLALTFVTLTIPIQFEGNLITIFWAAEAVLLFWLSQKSGISSFKLGGIIVQLLAIISLIMDWSRYDAPVEELDVIINPLFISGSLVAISFYLTFWLCKKEENIVTKYINVDAQLHRRLALLGGILATYCTGILEIHYQAFQFLENSISAVSFPVTYHFVFISGLAYLTSRVNKKMMLRVVLLIGAFSVMLYIALFYRLPRNEMIQNYVAGTTTEYAFYFHYIILASLVFLGYQLYKKIGSLYTGKSALSKWLPWVFVFAIVYVLSNEVMVHGLKFSSVVDIVELKTKHPDLDKKLYLKEQYVQTAVDKTQTQIIKIGYPILWGVFSFVFLIIGIRKQWKVLRIIALSLLGLTIVKLFIYDIKNVSETGKIIAFILLGVLVLVISFVYQKIKKLVVDEVTEDKNE